MALRDQHVVLTTVPASRPIFVCPTDTERKIGLTRFKHPANGQIKKDFAVKPIVIEAETIDPVRLCQFSLFLQDLCFTRGPPENLRQVRLWSQSRSQVC